jgi:phosphatidylinositol-3-phosphatase
MKRLCALLAGATLLCACAPASAAVPRFGHVFLIIGENTSYAQLTRTRAPYLTRTLRPQGAWLADYHTFTRSDSLGQYIAMVSGQFIGCDTHDALPAHCHQGVDNLFAQLAAKGRSWRDWQESMPAPCFRRDAGQPSRHNEYTAHHNPALYFTGLAASCRKDNVPMGATTAHGTRAFDRALRRGRVGDFNMVVPNDCENGHDPCGGDPVRHFDAFLAREVPRIEASPVFGRRSLIIVTWDEGADPPQDPGHVGALALGPLVRRGAVDRARVNHYGLERTLAEGFGVPPLAHARRARAITGIWR